jgi:opacity protein-like surface antigen
MKPILAALSLLASPIVVNAACHCDCDDYAFYLKVGSGVSVSTSSHVTAPSPPWNPALQGYNTNLGTTPIASLAVGCEFFHLLDLEVSIANRSTFKYRKFQTPATGGTSYTRQFDLSVTPILFSANLLGRGISCLSWDMPCATLYPVIGGSVGMSDLAITNYRTTGLPPTGSSTPYPSFSAENSYTLRKKFTYTLLAGVEYNYKDHWALSTGYRWFDAGSFKGPQYQRVSSGAAVDVGSDTWKMRFKANEWFVEFKIFL